MIGVCNLFFIFCRDGFQSDELVASLDFILKHPLKLNILINLISNVIPIRNPDKAEQALAVALRNLTVNPEEEDYKGNIQFVANQYSNLSQSGPLMSILYNEDLMKLLTKFKAFEGFDRDQMLSVTVLSKLSSSVGGVSRLVPLGKPFLTFNFSKVTLQVIGHMLRALMFLCSDVEVPPISEFMDVFEELEDNDQRVQCAAYRSAYIAKVGALIDAQLESAYVEPGILSKSLLEAMEDAYVDHLGPVVAFVGYPESEEELERYSWAMVRFLDEITTTIKDDYAELLEARGDGPRARVFKGLVNRWKHCCLGVVNPRGLGKSTTCTLPPLTGHSVHDLIMLFDKRRDSFDAVN
jgi:hypothetical protein